MRGTVNLLELFVRLSSFVLFLAGQQPSGCWHGVFPMAIITVLQTEMHPI